MPPTADERRFVGEPFDRRDRVADNLATRAASRTVDMNGTSPTQRACRQPEFLTQHPQKWYILRDIDVALVR